MLVRPQLWGQPLPSMLLALGGVVALLSGLQRLLYPVAALSLTAARMGIGLGLLSTALGLSLMRARVSQALVERLRSLVYARLGTALRSVPVFLPPRLPPMEQLGPQVARSLPWVEIHFGRTLPILCGNALALPALVCLAWSEIGSAGTVMALAALSLAACVASIAWRRARSATKAAAEKYRGIASSVERGLRSRVELRVHGLGARYEQRLAEQVSFWATLDKRAHRLRAWTSWSLPIFAVAMLMLIALWSGYDVEAWLSHVSRGGHETVAAGVLLISVVPVLVGLSRGAANALHERTFVQAVAPLFELPSERSSSVSLEGGGGDILLQDAWFEFEGNGDAAPVVVRAELRFRRDESLALLGPNGCGKTSVALAVMGLLRPTRGRCVVQRGLQVFDTSYLAGHVAFLPQNSYFGQHETVREAISFVAPDATEEEVAALLVQFWATEQLQGLLGQRVSLLSAGQQRVVALCRVLLRRAPLIVLDEPETNLDVTTAEKVVSLLRAAAHEQRMLILTHDSRFSVVATRALQFGDDHTLVDPEYRTWAGGRVPDGGQDEPR